MFPTPNKNNMSANAKTNYAVQSTEQLYVIPITTIQTNSNVAVNLRTVTQPIQHKQGLKSTIPLGQREQNRRVKKQNLERRRRACISDKLTALHNLSVTLIGETPQSQPQQRTEITDILNQCVNVLQGLNEFVQKNPDLQAKMKQLGYPIKKTLFNQTKRARSGTTKSSQLSDCHHSENNKENVQPQKEFNLNRTDSTLVDKYMHQSINLKPINSMPYDVSTPKYTSKNNLLINDRNPVGNSFVHPNSLSYSTSFPNSSWEMELSTDNALKKHLKRSSVDSCFSTPSYSSDSFDSSDLKSKKRFNTPSSAVWRPYLD